MDVVHLGELYRVLAAASDYPFLFHESLLWRPPEPHIYHFSCGEDFSPLEKAASNVVLELQGSLKGGTRSAVRASRFSCLKKATPKSQSRQTTRFRRWALVEGGFVPMVSPGVSLSGDSYVEDRNWTPNVHDVSRVSPTG